MAWSPDRLGSRRSTIGVAPSRPANQRGPIQVSYLIKVEAPERPGVLHVLCVEARLILTDCESYDSLDSEVFLSSFLFL